MIHCSDLWTSDATWAGTRMVSYNRSRVPLFLPGNPPRSTAPFRSRDDGGSTPEPWLAWHAQEPMLAGHRAWSAPFEPQSCFGSSPAATFISGRTTPSHGFELLAMIREAAAPVCVRGTLSPPHLLGERLRQCVGMVRIIAESTLNCPPMPMSFAAIAIVDAGFGWLITEN